MLIDPAAASGSGPPALRRAVAVALVVVGVFGTSGCGDAARGAVPSGERATPTLTGGPVLGEAPAAIPIAPPEPAGGADFGPVSTLVDDAIAAHRLPGAVVLVGHGGQVVFHQAYGARKLAGEPGLDGSPAPAEPMTEDTDLRPGVVDEASRDGDRRHAALRTGQGPARRPRAEVPAGLQRGATIRTRAEVTVRMLLTHTSGEPGDVELRDPWGLDRADRAEGFHRALTTPLQSSPGEVFRYSDINFILLGALIEKVTGETRRRSTCSRTSSRRSA